ncbi:conserved Plasmodium protein, unknown function [Plasmodium malariae]|uniref:UBA domain-containing protein n=1 Tax=Plasmodium malariae TaxID=5858 RepID=A0A1A8WVR1_PLAMA|nr:conserved Plasmodium protein, unknown function [Plasmodium malariae]
MMEGKNKLLEQMLEFGYSREISLKVLEASGAKTSIAKKSEAQKNKKLIKVNKSEARKNKKLIIVKSEK